MYQTPNQMPTHRIIFVSPSFEISPHSESELNAIPNNSFEIIQSVGQNLNDLVNIFFGLGLLSINVVQPPRINIVHVSGYPHDHDRIGKLLINTLGRINCVVCSGCDDLATNIYENTFIRVVIATSNINKPENINFLSQLYTNIFLSQLYTNILNSQSHIYHDFHIAFDNACIVLNSSDNNPQIWIRYIDEDRIRLANRGREKNEFQYFINNSEYRTYIITANSEMGKTVLLKEFGRQHRSMFNQDYLTGYVDFKSLKNNPQSWFMQIQREIGLADDDLTQDKPEWGDVVSFIKTLNKREYNTLITIDSFNQAPDTIRKNIINNFIKVINNPKINRGQGTIKCVKCVIAGTEIESFPDEYGRILSGTVEAIQDYDSWRFYALLNQYSPPNRSYHRVLYWERRLQDIIDSLGGIPSGIDKLIKQGYLRENNNGN
jgi:flagella basal body P-ring formation protein FlgA